MTSTFPTFPNFEILRILGKGGMGTVYLARDQRLGRQVALKVLNTGEMANEDRRTRFLREARAAASIRHQNVATIYEVGEDPEGIPFIVMEYCEGETLSQRVRRRAFEPVELISVARQIASGLEAAHGQGIVHRDIKSANIIIEPTGLIKILDFGLAKSIPRSMTDPGLETSIDSTTGHFFGTLHFISPEQARGGTADVRSDLFSLGVVLYHAASGRLPFNAEAPLLVLEKIRSAEPEPLVPINPDFPPAAIRVIGKLLQKEPADRYQSADQVLADLEEIDIATARLSSFTARTTLRTIRRPRWTRVAITVGAALVVAITAFVIQRSREEPVPAPVMEAPAPIRSMAVLPLRNIANSTRDEFLSVGVADALVTELQRIPSLRVRPTSAVLQFNGAETDARKASEQLKVDSVLEGRFLAAGDLVRVTLQLTDTRTGFSVWSDSIDGRRDDLLALIDEVSRRTVTGLNQKIGVLQPAVARSEARSVSPKAYEEYLRARSLSGSFVPAHFEAQIKALKNAVALDPNFAAAYADLASTLSLGQARSLVSEEDLAKAEWYARQAVRLDPNLPQAHLALGRVFVRDPERYRESVRAVLAAIRLDSSDTHALHSVVTYFVSTGDLQKAQCVGDRLVQTDPLSNEALLRGYWNVNAVDPEGALKYAELALSTKETSLAGHDIRGYAHLLLGRLAEAEADTRQARRVAPDHYLGRSLDAMLSAARGDREKALFHVRAFEADAGRNHWAALRVALVYAKLGDEAAALTWLRRCAELGNHSWYALVKHPWLASLQDNPEFQEIVAQMKEDLDDVRDDVVGVYQLLCK